MDNREILSQKEISSEFSQIGEHMFTIHCIKDNISLLADGLALKDDNESSNALTLCADTLAEAVGKLSECIDILDMKFNRENKRTVSDKDE